MLRCSSLLAKSRVVANSSVCAISLVSNRRQSTAKLERFSRDSDWSREEIDDALEAHSLSAWSPSTSIQGLLRVTHGQGPYLFDSDGKKYFDLSSQAVCCNLGHSMPESVQKAINEQIEKIPYVFGVMAVTEVRAKMSKLMADLMPGDISAFVFLTTGSEANECGIRIARHYTGKHKILSRRRSYHGGSLGALAMTGDSRTHMLEPMAPPGFLKMPDPVGGSGLSAFEWTDDAQCLAALEEQILSEGPETVAAIWLESITGTCGWMRPSVEYVSGVRALCDKYNICLGFDEVMAGIGRTGKMFAFENFPGVIPDIVCGAKGITGAYLPLGYVGVGQKLQEFFRTNAMPFGGTYQAHPTCLAAAMACMRYVIDNELVSKAKANESVILSEMGALQKAFPSAVAAYRCTGMAAAIEIAPQRKDPGVAGRICNYNETHPTMLSLKTAFLRNGLNTMWRGPIIHVAPPLICTAAQIQDAFVDIHKSFAEVF